MAILLRLKNELMNELFPTLDLPQSTIAGRVSFGSESTDVNDPVKVMLLNITKKSNHPKKGDYSLNPF